MSDTTANPHRVRVAIIGSLLAMSLAALGALVTVLIALTRNLPVVWLFLGFFGALTVALGSWVLALRLLSKNLENVQAGSRLWLCSRRYDINRLFETHYPGMLSNRVTSFFILAIDSHTVTVWSGWFRAKQALRLTRNVTDNIGVSATRGYYGSATGLSLSLGAKRDRQPIVFPLCRLHPLGIFMSISEEELNEAVMHVPPGVYSTSDPRLRNEDPPNFVP